MTAPIPPVPGGLRSLGFTSWLDVVLDGFDCIERTPGTEANARAELAALRAENAEMRAVLGQIVDEGRLVLGDYRVSFDEDQWTKLRALAGRG